MNLLTRFGIMAQNLITKGKAYFDGVGDSLSLADNEDFSFGSGNFCIEFNIKFNTLPTVGNYQAFYYHQSVGVDNYFIIQNTGGVYQIILNSSTCNFLTNITISAGEYFNLTVSRNGNTFKLFKNGIQVGSDYTSSVTFLNPTGGFYIGSYTNADAFLNGYIYGIRITKGLARYTSNFTPPIEFANDANTVLCMNFAEPIGSTTFIDETGKTVTTYGNTIIVA